MTFARNIKGVRIRTLNMIMLLLSLVFFIAVLYTTLVVWKEYNAHVKLTDNYIVWEQMAHRVHTSSDFLTESARLFTQTGKKKFAERYNNELDNKGRQKISEFLAAQNSFPVRYENLQKALMQSNNLTATELYAMRLAAEARNLNLDNFPPRIKAVKLSQQDSALFADQKLELARDMLFNDDYQHSKESILSLLNSLVDQNLTQTRTEQKEQTTRLGEVLLDQRIMLAALCILNILTFIMIIVLIVKPLQIYLRCIRNDKMLEIIGAYEFKHLALTYNDIFAVKERHDKMLKHKAEHDHLTGLLNRSAFDSLRHLLVCDEQPVALLLVDVDKFKDINDTYGHEMGDRALQRVAELLRQSFRTEDLCIRLGGDEFAVILHGEGSIIKQRVLSKVNYINNELQHPKDDMPPISLSVGVAVSHAGFPDSLYQNADKALYQVKEAGRCGCKFYEET